MDLNSFISALEYYKRLPVYVKSLFPALRLGLLKYLYKFEGYLSLPEALYLYRASLSLPKSPVIVELGCYKGLSTAILLSALRKKKGFLYSIDTFDDYNASCRKIISGYKNKRFRSSELSLLGSKVALGNVYQNLRSQGFSRFKLMAGYSFEWSRKWKGKIDMLFIDAGHGYGEVKRDFLEWSKFIKKGGIIAFHDANNTRKTPYWRLGWEGPTRVFEKYVLKGRNWKVLERVESLAIARKIS